MAGDVQGSFSFTMTAQWDYISRRKLQKYIDNPYQLSIDNRIDMKSAVERLLSGGKWRPYSSVTDIQDTYKGGELFPFSDHETRRPLYAEYLYFNSNVRDIIYNKIPGDFIWKDGDTPYAENKKQWIKDARRYAKQVEALQQPVVVLERINGNEKPYYDLARLSSNEDANFQTGQISLAFYRLPITSIELRLYRTGVMLLSFRCHNENFEEKKGAHYTVLRISKTFRYAEGNRAQVFADNLEACFREKSSARPDKWAPVAEQADLSWIEDAGRRLFLARPAYDIFRDFPSEAPLHSAFCLDSDKGCTVCDYRPAARKRVREDDNYPEHIAWTKNVIGPFCHSIQAVAAEQKAGKAASGKESACLIINCFNDDRMHVHGTIVSEALSARICSAYGKRHEQPDRVCLGQWYGMLAADHDWNRCSCQDQTMLLDLIDRQTDGRWSERNTLYGITYHTMIQLLGPDVPDYLITNMDWMYFQLFLIAVLQRCTVQRFYREASGLIRGNGSYDTKRGEALKSLYMLFMNQIWFNDVTEQEQGQDFFRRLQKNMDVEKDVAFLDQALSEMDDQAHKKLENIVSRQLLPLSVIGGLWGGIEMISCLINGEWTGDFSRHIQSFGWRSAGAWIPGILVCLTLILLLRFGLCSVLPMLRRGHKKRFKK